MFQSTEWNIRRKIRDAKTVNSVFASGVNNFEKSMSVYAKNVISNG